MMRYLTEPYNICKKLWIFAKNLSKNVGKKISKILSIKYSQKFFDYAKKSETDAIKAASKSNTKNSRNNWQFDW